MSTFNQNSGTAVPTLINSSAVLVTGNAVSSNALTVRQFGTGNVFSAQTTTGSTALFVGANGNVGVGTTSPGNLLHVSGGRTRLVAGSETYALGVSYSEASGGFYYIGATNSATPDMVFSQVGGSERMRITNGGLVGIGTTDPKAPLSSYTTRAGYPDASGTGSSNVVARIQSGSICLDFGSIGGTNPFWIQNHLSTNNATNYPILLNPNGGFVGIGTTNPSYTLDCWTGTVQANQVRSPGGNYLTLVNGAGGSQIALQGTTTAITGGVVYMTGGNVGIGTASPTAQFHVSGGRSRFDAASEPYAISVSYSQGTGGSYWIGASNSATPDLVFSQGGGSERMRITNAGNVGIGTASPSYPLQVQATAATGSTAARYFNNPTALTTTGGSVFNVSILGIGDIGTNGSIVAFSDRRAKILESDPTESYLNLVNKVDVRQYSWIDKISKDSSKKIGFFAQEVEKVLPDAVGTMTGVVPTIYHEADAFTESTITLTNHGLTTERKLEVVDPENGKTTIDIVRVIDADNLEVKFEKVPKDKLFVVGPEVDDSRMVNHDYLMAVGFGGLKELHALVKTQQTTIEMLTERLAALEAKLNSQ